MDDKNSVDQEGSDALKVANELIKDFAKYRRQFEKSWDEYEDAYYGKQHKTGEDKKTVKNHIFQIIEGEVPILTDSMPSTQITANISERQDDADILNKAIAYVYQDQSLTLTLPTLVRQSCISAPGYLYPFWNPDAEGGDGRVEHIELDRRDVWLDGNVSTIEKSSGAAWKIPIRRGSLARMFPEFKEQILQAPQDTPNNSADDNSFETRDVSSGDDQQSAPKSYSGKDVVGFYTVFVKDDALEDIPPDETTQQVLKERELFLEAEPASVTKWEDHENHNADHAKTRAEILAQINLPPDASVEDAMQAVQALSQQAPESADAIGRIPLMVQNVDNHMAEHEELKKLNPTGQRPKYSDGWRVIKMLNKKVVLYDGPNPEARNGIGHIPLVPFYCYKDKTIYGFGEVKNILDPQRTLNDVDWREYRNLQLGSNSGWKTDDPDLEEGKLTNAPGIVVKHAPGRSVERLPPVPVSPQLSARKEADTLAMRDISGVNEASQGADTGTRSGIAITKLQNQAIGRIRMKDRYLQGYSIRRLGIITATLILNHWTTEKRFRLRSDNSSVEDIVFDPIRLQDLEYTIDVAQGSMAGIDKDSLNQFYLELLKMQQIPFSDFLQVADFPKKEVLLKLLNERQGQEQQAQQMQAQAEQLAQENAQLKGLVSGNFLAPEEKSVFENGAKQALMEKIIGQVQPGNQVDPAGMAASLTQAPGASAGQPGQGA